MMPCLAHLVIFSSLIPAFAMHSEASQCNALNTNLDGIRSNLLRREGSPENVFTARTNVNRGVPALQTVGPLGCSGHWASSRHGLGTVSWERACDNVSSDGACMSWAGLPKGSSGR